MADGTTRFAVTDRGRHTAMLVVLKGLANATDEETDIVGVVGFALAYRRLRGDWPTMAELEDPGPGLLAEVSTQMEAVTADLNAELARIRAAARRRP